ncbi:RAMP superfamily CRISPR-associated protein [Paenibacillus sp. SYP-B4298]|uniref:RAMP superfamily CRISPR-associated protein n=1 Tax=Paenibacillus sp. SYP-B4298 TaxID=2996034 RepID=UPI0022DE742B|nr:RAMP superfamily CRISPR-associated protein [Paenibacillus sp. SYP-B4298]
MKAGWLDIELRSELCTGTGNTTAGLIDMEIAHEHGLPIIPAKRLKGSLLEAGKELADWGVLQQDELSALFGASGEAGSAALQVYDAHLYRLPRGGETIVVEDYEELRRQLQSQQELNEQEVLEQWTSLHTRTAIAADGVAADGSLRTMRAANKGLVLRSRIELHVADEATYQQLHKTLERCVLALRSLGLATTRGSGEVRCSLSAADRFTPGQAHMELNKLETSPANGSEWVELPYRLVLEQPVIVAAEDGLDSGCEDWIPGRAMLGAFAGLYVRAFKLGERAHEEERFARIFLRGGVQFGYALPLCENRVFAPCPAVWQQVKNEDRMYDVSIERAKEQVILRNLNSMVHLDASSPAPKLWKYEVRKHVRMHHAKASNRAIGRALGQEYTAHEKVHGVLEPNQDARGQLYQYESMVAGQQFYGVLRGRQEDVKLLQELMAHQDNRLRIGRSRTAEYGNVRIHFGQEAARPLLVTGADEQRMGKYMIALVTPMLLLDEHGRPAPDPARLMEELQQELKCTISLHSMRLKYTVLSGYNSKWRLPKPQRSALDAGSALIVTTQGEGQIDLGLLESRLWGSNKGEGCGQIKVIPLPLGTTQGAEQFIPLSTDTAQGAERFIPVVSAKWSAADLQGSREHRHPLLERMVKYREEHHRQRQQLLEGAENARQDRLGAVSKTRIRQLLEWAEMDDGAYASLLERINGITDETAKSGCIRLLQPCEGKDSHFIRGYLRALELKARETGK